MAEERELIWIATSREDLKTFPEEVKDVMGYALHLAQVGEKHPDARPLKGFSPDGVFEVRDDHATDTYRVMYAVKLKTAIYVLHSFQKKSKRGVATPPKEMELVRRRLADARASDMERASHGGRNA